MRVEGHSDVLIVGAGPAGCAAGITLARAGASVCVLDRARFPRDKTCGDAVSSQAVALLDELCAPEASVWRDKPHATVARAAAVLPDGSRIERGYERAGCIVPRFHLDDALRVALERHGATLLQGVHVRQLRRERVAGRMCVVGAEGQDFHWSSRIVIAADGHGSVGLAALDQSLPRGRQLAVSVTAYMRGVSFPHGAQTADHFFEHELPYGYSWIFPEVSGVANVGVYLRADAYTELTRVRDQEREQSRRGGKLGELLDAFIARHPGRFAHAERVGKPRIWSLPIAPRPRRISGDGVLLAGDAGGFVDPLSGEGIYQALYTGKLAGQVASSALAQGRLSPLLCARYEAQCARAIAWPSCGKAMVQAAMAKVVEHRLYRHRAVRELLAYGYEHRVLDASKR